MNTRNLIIAGLFFSMSLSVFAQKYDLVACRAHETALSKLYIELYAQTTDSAKAAVNEQIIRRWKLALGEIGMFDYPFDSLTRVSRLTADGALLRMVTWNVAHNDGTFTYFGFVQNRPKRKKEPVNYWLTDASDAVQSPGNQTLPANSWFGALYYDIQWYEYGKYKYYILFGWDGNNTFTNKKLLDVLYFDDLDQPKFGAPIFERAGRQAYRVIFEFAEKASMTLRYDNDLGIIVFDKLVPSSPSLEGNFQYYGPSFEFDTFVLTEEGKWIFKEYGDVRNPD